MRSKWNSNLSSRHSDFSNRSDRAFLSTTSDTPRNTCLTNSWPFKFKPYLPPRHVTPREQWAPLSVSNPPLFLSLLSTAATNSGRRRAEDCLSRIGLWGSISFEALMRLFLCCCVEFGLNPSVNFGDGWENSWARGGIRLCCKYLLRILQLCLIGTTKR